jgi:ABC-type sugar transport system permease subunit
MSKAIAKSQAFLNFKDKFGSFMFVLPAITIFTIFYIYPFYKTFQLSLHEWNGISPTQIFVGIDNFKQLMGDGVWWSSMWHAAYITLIALTLQNMVALALALACDREIRMKNFYRVIFFIPPVLSEVVVGLIWRWLLEYNANGPQYAGSLNSFLNSIGLHHLINNWLSNPKTALTCIAVVHSWKGFGWGFIILLAGLQTIDRQLYEAAKVDGSGSFSTFMHVTIPMMIPVILVVVILTILGSMQAFVLILSMMGQGLGYHTEVPVTRILVAMMGTKEYGYACAMGINFGFILVVVSLIMKKMSDRMKQEQRNG